MDCIKVPYSNIFTKVVHLEASVVGTGFTPQGKLIGNVLNLLGLPSNAVVISLFFEDALLTPGAIMVGGCYNRNLYIGTTQNTTLSGGVVVKAVYTLT